MADLLKDESGVKSALLDEEKLLVREFSDSEKLDKSYKDKNLTKVKESDKKEPDKSAEKPKESEKKDGK